MQPTYDASILYPIVHDLSETDSPSPPNQSCCAGEGGLLDMYFELKDLLSPWDKPIMGRRRIRADSTDSAASEPSSLQRSYAPTKPERFQDAYVLTRQIYQGRSCTVWESINRRSGMRYATKIVDRRSISAMEDARVLREVALLKSLEKGNGTISCIDFYQESNHFYIVSEYAEGGSLRDRLEERRRLPEEQVKTLARSILEGLKYLHHYDICHRNLKPENILIHVDDEGDMRALIADFGTAVHLPYFDGGRGQITGNCGSPLYAAPEVQNRQPYHTKCDMWSLGVILFLALSGSLPFVDRNQRSMLRKISKAEFIFDPRDWSTVSRSARRFIYKLLRANPSERMSAERALHDPWLAPPPLPAVAEEAPIEQTLSETVGTKKKVRFVDLPKSNKKSKKLHRVFSSMLRRKKESEAPEGDDDSVSSNTISTTSTDPSGLHYLGATPE